MSIDINIYYTLYKFIGTVIKPPGEHNHAPDPLEVEVRKTSNKIKKKAVSSTDAPSKLIKKAMTTVSEQAGVQLASTSSLNRTIQRARAAEGVNVNNANDIGSMEIPHFHTRTIRGSTFLCFDNSDGEFNTCYQQKNFSFIYLLFGAFCRRVFCRGVFCRGVFCRGVFCRRILPRSPNLFFSSSRLYIGIAIFY